MERASSGNYAIGVQVKELNDTKKSPRNRFDARLCSVLIVARCIQIEFKLPFLKEKKSIVNRNVLGER